MVPTLMRGGLGLVSLPQFPWAHQQGNGTLNKGSGTTLTAVGGLPVPVWYRYYTYFPSPSPSCSGSCGTTASPSHPVYAYCSPSLKVDQGGMGGMAFVL